MEMTITAKALGYGGSSIQDDGKGKFFGGDGQEARIVIEYVRSETTDEPAQRWQSDPI
jgi:hypothetical protein